MNHTQETTTNWLECITRLPDGMWGKVLAIQWAAEVVATKPTVGQVLRYVNDGLQQVNSNDTEAVREARSRDWFNRFIDGTFLDGQTAGIPHWQAVKAVSWWNEYYADSQTTAEKELWWRQERTAAHIWRDEYRNGPNANKLQNIRLAIGATAVGNNIPWQSAQTAVQYDCVLDYHPYSHWTRNANAPARAISSQATQKQAGREYSMNMAGALVSRPARAAENTPVRSEGDWQYLSGRWATMDADFRSRGYFVDWFFGEAGPFESAVTGWRSASCLNANVNDYVNAVRLWLRDVKTTPAWAQRRILGFALFTTAGGSLWPGFQTRQPELNTLAEMVAEEWVMEDTDMTWQEEIWQQSVDEQIARGIPLNPNAGLQQMIVTHPGNYTPVTRERTVTTADGQQRGFMAGESTTGSGPRLVWSFVLPWSGPGGVTVFPDPN
jgi:hypothetical protein